MRCLRDDSSPDHPSRLATGALFSAPIIWSGRDRTYLRGLRHGTSPQAMGNENDPRAVTIWPTRRATHLATGIGRLDGWDQEESADYLANLRTVVRARSRADSQVLLATNRGGGSHAGLCRGLATKPSSRRAVPGACRARRRAPPFTCYERVENPGVRGRAPAHLPGMCGSLRMTSSADGNGARALHDPSRDMNGCGPTSKSEPLEKRRAGPTRHGNCHEERQWPIKPTLLFLLGGAIPRR